MDYLRTIFENLLSKIIFICLSFLLSTTNVFAAGNSNLHLGLQLDYKNKQSSSTESSIIIQNLSKIFNVTPNIRITIFGFSDLSGNKKEDNKIALQRAEDIKKQLSKQGTLEKNLKTSTLVEFDSIIKNKKVFGQKQNRRIVLKIENASFDEITSIISWSKNQKNILVVDPLGTKIKDIKLLTEMLRSQNKVDFEIKNQNNLRLPASE